MSEFRKTDFRNGDIFITNDGTEYLFIDGYSYNMETGDYIHHRHDGLPPDKFSNKVKKRVDMVKRFFRNDTLTYVSGIESISQAIKILKCGVASYRTCTIWVREDEESKRKAREIAAAKAAVEDAQYNLKNAQERLKNLQ